MHALPGMTMMKAKRIALAPSIPEGIEQQQQQQQPKGTADDEQILLHQRGSSSMESPSIEDIIHPSASYGRFGHHQH